MALVWEALESRSEAWDSSTGYRYEQARKRAFLVPIGVYRAKVPGGWLVRVETEVDPASGGACVGVTFYPDPEHAWDGSSIE